MWTVMTTEEFDRWLCEQDESTQEKVLAALVMLERAGPPAPRRAAGVSKKWPKRCCLKHTCISCGKR